MNADGIAPAGSRRHTRQGWRYRANIAARTLAGTVGGYAIAALFAAALARTLATSRIEATIVATLLALLIVPLAMVWAFLARGPWRAWAGILAAALLLGGIAWLAGAPT